MSMEKAARGLMGIYCIRHSSSGMCYVGSSASIHNRLKAHMDFLSKGTHINHDLQERWHKD